MPANPLTIAQIRTFPVGTPVPMIQGLLTEVYEYRPNIGRNKSTVQSAMLQDAAGDKIRINIWNHKNYAVNKGTPITIIALTDKGKCSTRTIENTYHTPPALELEVSKNSQVLISGDQGEAPPADHSDPGEDESAGRTDSTPCSQPIQRRQNGQNVGMCVKEAVGIVMRMEGAENLEYVLSPEFYKNVWFIAGDLMRISKMLEEGEMAPNAKIRANPPAPPPAVTPTPVPPPTVQPAAQQPPPSGKTKPGPEGAAFDPNDPGIDDDVPF